MGDISMRRSARFGDVIGVDRGLYQHFGVYVSNDCVIEYAAPSGDFGGTAQVQAVSLQKFLQGQTNYFICIFPAQPPEISAKGADESFVQLALLLRRTIKGERYHLYTPEETVQRARSRLGETAYNLALNNCEHFAVWCKTGVSESAQVNRILAFMEERIRLRLKQS